MQPTLHQLKIFEAAARHANFTRAAEELYLTQPTVSMQMKQLCKTVGFPLFEKFGRKLYLTEVGNCLYSTSKAVLEELSKFEMIMGDLQGITHGKLHLATDTTCKYFVSGLLGNFCDQYPDIDISLGITNYLQLEKRIVENRDDLYFLSHSPQDLDLQVQPVIKNPLVVVAPLNHPLVNQRNIDISALNQERFIMREPGSGTRHAVLTLLNQHKIKIDIKLELGSDEVIKQAILEGLGISVLSRHSLNGQESINLAILDIEHFPIDQQLSVAYLSGKHLTAVAVTFRDYLVSVTEKAEIPWMQFCQ